MQVRMVSKEDGTSYTCNFDTAWDEKLSGYWKDKEIARKHLLTGQNLWTPFRIVEPISETSDVA